MKKNIKDDGFLDIDSNEAFIQTHLNIIQNIIQRMAANSTNCKTWCISLVSAILVIVVDKNKPEYSLIAILPTIAFFTLDTYYLALERRFRNLYNDFISKIHNRKLPKKDLFSVSSKENMFKLYISSIGSFSIWPYYLLIVLLILGITCI